MSGIYGASLCEIIPHLLPPRSCDPHPLTPSTHITHRDVPVINKQTKKNPSKTICPLCSVLIQHSETSRCTTAVHREQKNNLQYIIKEHKWRLLRNP